MNTLSEMRQVDGFVNVMENIIRPSKDHAEVIREVLTDHHKKIRGFREQHIVELQEIMDSLKTDLKPYLTEKQQERFEKMRSRKGGFGKPQFHRRKDMKY
jgi:hypothetical protein